MMRRPQSDGTEGVARAVTEHLDPTSPALNGPIPTSTDPVADRRHRLPLTDVVVQLTWSLDDISRLTTLSRRLLERMLSCGRMPRADLQIGRRRLWFPASIFRWLEAEKEGRP
jgi:hypothetical protein